MAGLTKEEFDRIFAKANELWDTAFFTKHARAAMDVYLAEQENEFGCRLHSRMQNLESPLEAAFLAWWMVVAPHVEFSLCSQRTVTIGDCNYRLDFTIRPVRGSFLDVFKEGAEPKIAVELDGHDFHEKTKEQVTYRNRRDRDLQTAGWVVLHVSGSEFNANPQRVTKEIHERSSNLMYAAYHGRRT